MNPNGPGKNSTWRVGLEEEANPHPAQITVGSSSRSGQEHTPLSSPGVWQPFYYPVFLVFETAPAFRTTYSLQNQSKKKKGQK